MHATSIGDQYLAELVVGEVCLQAAAVFGQPCARVYAGSRRGRAVSVDHVVLT